MGKKSTLGLVLLAVIVLLITAFVVYYTSSNLAVEDSDAATLSTGVYNSNSKYQVDCGNLDYNKNGVIDYPDFSRLATLMGRSCRSVALDTKFTGCGSLDYNSDKVINETDFNALVVKWGKSCTSTEFVDCGYMDSNATGTYTILDFSTLATNYGKICRGILVSDVIPNPLDPANCGPLDADYSAIVDGPDFTVLKLKFGESTCKTGVTTGYNTGVCGDLDFDYDNAITAKDYQTLYEYNGFKCTDAAMESRSSCGKKDVNGDNVINQTDFTAAGEKLGDTCTNL